MSTASLVILLLGTFIVAVKGLRIVSLWRDVQGERVVPTISFAESSGPESQASEESGNESAAASEDDLGVALALALRDAEADAQGKWSTLDSP